MVNLLKLGLMKRLLTEKFLYLNHKQDLSSLLRLGVDFLPPCFFYPQEATKRRILMSKKDNAKKYIKKRKHPFVQIPSAIFDATKNKSTICLYLSLMTYADSEGFCFPSYSKINEQTGMSSATISKSLDELQKVGLLTIEKHKRHGNVQENNTYFLEFDFKKVYTSKIEVGKVSTSKTKVGSTSKTKVGLLQKLKSNYNQDNNNHKELYKGAKALSPQATQSEISLSDPKITKLDILKKELSILEDYPKQDRLDFYSYWTEVDSFAKNKVMRFEKAKPFNVKRRLATWMGKKANWQNPAQMKTERDEFKMKATMGMTLHQKVQWEYDNKFITKEQLESMNIQGIDL